MHASMWVGRLRGDERFEAAVDELWPYALGVLPESSAPSSPSASGGPSSMRSSAEAHSDELRELWEEMTMVRRSVPGATW